jgi:hypothetical protein
VDIRLLRHPSAFMPLTMSVAALAVVLGHAAVYGVVHEQDEGAAAHVFQFLMTVQLPVVAYFIVKWVRRAPRAWAPVLGLQSGAWLLACCAVAVLT